MLFIVGLCAKDSAISALKFGFDAPYCVKSSTVTVKQETSKNVLVVVVVVVVTK